VALREARRDAVWLARFPEENPNPVLRVSFERTILYRNQAAAGVLGCTCEAGKPLPPAFADVFDDAVSTGRMAEAEVALGPAFYAVSIVPFPAEGYANLYARDTTKRHRAEVAAEEARLALEREKDLLQAVMNGAWTTHLAYLDRDFDFVRVNEAYARACGYTPEAMIGKNHFVLYPHEENEAIFKRVRDTGVPLEYHDKPFTYPDQPERGVTYWDWTLLPVRDASGEVQGLVLSLVETTARKRAEDALREANEDLERKVLERTAELALRAAKLRALAGELTLAEQRERRRLAKVLHDHLQQLLVCAKLRLSQLARVRSDGVPRAVSEIEAILGEAIDASRSLTAELSPAILHERGLPEALLWLARWMETKHELQVQISVDEGIPQLTEDLRVLLFESVRELLFNVVKHAGVAVASVRVLRNAGNEISIEVSDAGPGFDPRELPPAGAMGGGFGLFSIRERLELMGGVLEIDSAPGRGARFILSVPLAQTVTS